MKMNETFLLSKNNRNKIYFSCIILKRFFSLELAIFVNNYLKKDDVNLKNIDGDFRLYLREDDRENTPTMDEPNQTSK